MSTSSRVPVLRVPLVAAAAAAPLLVRWVLRESVGEPITAGHVLLAQVSLLPLVALGLRVAWRDAERSVALWRRWAADATKVGGAMALLLAAHVVSGQVDPAAVPLDALTLVVTAPIVEEIVYRGFLPVLLARDGGTASTGPERVSIAIVSSAAFGVAHVGADGLAGVALARFALSFGCGLGFCVLRDASGGLVAPMVAHAGVNAMSLRAMV